MSENSQSTEISDSTSSSDSTSAYQPSSNVDDSDVSSELVTTVMQSDESDDSDHVEFSPESETSVAQSTEVSVETESLSVQSDEITSESAPLMVQSVEVAISTESPANQPVEIPLQTEPSAVQPIEAPSRTELRVEEAVTSIQSGQASSEAARERVTRPHVIPFPKRRRVVSPDIQEKKADVSLNDDDSCSICFESWTTSGNHRPACLKCGHLFGFMCIDKWLRGNGEKCPQCNAKAKRNDIRIIFARSIKAVDTIERDRALEQLDQVQKRNTELMVETAHLGLKYQVVMSECNRLQSELRFAKEEVLMLKCKLNSNINTSSQVPCTQDLENLMGNETKNFNSQELEPGKFVLKKTIPISEGGNCRVMAHSQFLGTIAVSQPSSVALFPGFGIKKISSLDLKTTEYVTLHSKAIRNVCFHPTYHDGVLLSCSLDKTVKLTSMISNTIVQVYNLPFGAWSCVWNTDDHNYFYVGLQNGLVQEYDVRKTDSYVRQLNMEGSRSPVASLQYIPACPNAHFRPGGLLVGQLNQVSFYEKISGNDYKTHFLPLDGMISSLCFDLHTRQMLASFRSSTNHPKVRHMVCELRMIGDNNSLCSCNPIQTFYGGSTQTLLSRSILVPHPLNKDHLFVCASDEATRGVKIWNSQTFSLSQNVLCDGTVVDLCYIDMNHHFLLALTDKKLKFCEWKK